MSPILVSVLTVLYMLIGYGMNRGLDIFYDIEIKNEWVYKVRLLVYTLTWPIRAMIVAIFNFFSMLIAGFIY